MKAKLQFAIYDSDDNLIVEGSVAQCAKAIGVTDKKFRRLMEVNRQRKYNGYFIVDISDEKPAKISEWERSRNAEAIAKWDAFVTPIREAYGVPVYREKKEGGAEWLRE